MDISLSLSLSLLPPSLPATQAASLALYLTLSLTLSLSLFLSLPQSPSPSLSNIWDALDHLHVWFYPALGVESLWGELGRDSNSV